MRRAKPLPPPIRNKIDLKDHTQVRILKKRLGISGDDLRRTVEKVGNSIAAISKEIEVQRSPPTVPPAPAIVMPAISPTDELTKAL